jgi:hypothetical protein
MAAKVDIQNLTIYQMWNLSMITHTEVGKQCVRSAHAWQVSNGFVVCGVLYLPRSATALKTDIAIAYDFYRHKYTMPDIDWINLYKHTNMVQYSPYDKRIYVYDHGYLLSMPARLHWRAR